MNSMMGSRGMISQTGAGMGNRTPKGYELSSIQNFTPEQMELFRSQFANVAPDSYTSRLARGDQGLFNEMEAPALRQFSGLQGNIASRFSGMGTGGRRSSGFQNYTNQATSDFAQDLQSRRQELQRNAIRDLQGMSSDLLGQKPYETFLQPKKRSWWESLLGGAAPIAGAGIGALLGGPAGASIGGQIGSQFSSGLFGD